MLARILFIVLFLATSPFAVAQKKAKLPKHDDIVIINTRFGEIHLQLFDETPKHKQNMVKLANEKFYDSIAFHRVLDNFMIQGGDPNTKPGGDMAKAGNGGPGYNVEAEIVDKFKHDMGMLAAARLGDSMNPKRESSGSQFYIVENEDGAHHLDGTYSIFGKVLKGMDVVRKIAEQKVDKSGRPAETIRMAMKVLHQKRKKIKKTYGDVYSGI